MCKFALHRIVSLSLLFSLLPGTLAALDKTASNDFIVEPLTLISRRFEWHIDGDDNRKPEMHKFRTLQEFSTATGQGIHSVLVGYDSFQQFYRAAPRPRSVRSGFQCPSL